MMIVEVNFHRIFKCFLEMLSLRVCKEDNFLYHIFSVSGAAVSHKKEWQRYSHDFDCLFSSK